MTSIITDKQAEVDQNYEAFLKALPEIKTSHAGQYVVLRKRKIVRYFSTDREAVLYGVKEFTDGLFSVQEVNQIPIDLGWFSNAPLHR